uniref:Heptaprenyl diphosphate synthase subunit II n=1 Tax=uncultured Candidatus Melainabacteria bacterium TaxID=2682970 RepID=A0A650EKR5_9BACT|nr:heptaprenyl diphosphate synthase subunit II [uncultured Candidatus Melainabacteria bacterium]
MNFNEKYKKIRHLIQKEINIIEEKMVTNINIHEPLQTSVTNFLKAPSKRIRPLISILYLKACGEDPTDKQLEVLTLVELVHNASLIHDDIIDESTIRRGIKTISAEFNNKLGVITGDYILSIVLEKLIQINNTEITKMFAKTIKQMTIGEINQYFERFKLGTLESYLEKTQDKTAYLFETALICPALLSKTTHNLKKISKLGLSIGTAFQIRDDILNFTQNDQLKPTKNDITEGIYNAPIILGDKSENYTSGIEKTKVLLNNYIQSAKNIINELPENQYKTALEEFLELLINV